MPYHTCINRQRATRMQKSAGKEWDQVWIGANIATMAAGAEPYGQIKDARWP